MGKVKLGVNVRSELNEKLNELTEHANLLVQALKVKQPDVSAEVATTKSEIVEVILEKGIEELRLKFEKIAGYEPLSKVAVEERIESIRMENLMNSKLLPTEVEYKEAMFEILLNLPENKCSSSKMYDLLADYFQLNEEQLNAGMPSNPSRNWHKNRAQWARNSLRKDNVIDGSEHGVWRLNAYSIQN